jgi:hypothetical protein
MKVPTTGKECPYFYGDYFRGRHHEECRLIGDADPPWQIQDCKTCPVPDIVRANSCEHMVLSAEIAKGFLGLHRHVKVSAYCTKTHQDVKDPYVGCGKCHPIIDLFKESE